MYCFTTKKLIFEPFRLLKTCFMVLQNVIKEFGESCSSEWNWLQWVGTISLWTNMFNILNYCQGLCVDEIEIEVGRCWRHYGVVNILFEQSQYVFPDNCEPISTCCNFFCITCSVWFEWHVKFWLASEELDWSKLFFCF